MLCMSSHDLYCADQDAIMTNIQEKSNVTQSDVNRWKFFWLKQAAMPLGTGLGLYGLYQAGKFGYSVPTAYEQHITNAFKSLNIPAIFANNLESLAKSKFLWAVVGVYGANKIFNNLLWPRLPSYSFDKVESFLNLCRHLQFANTQCNSVQDFVRAIPDRSWCVNGVDPLRRAFDNLIEQADAAYALLEQLKNSKFKSIEELSSMQTEVMSIKNNIAHNKMFITQESVQLCSKKITPFMGAVGEVLTVIFFPWILLFEALRSNY